MLFRSGDARNPCRSGRLSVEPSSPDCQRPTPRTSGTADLSLYKEDIHVVANVPYYITTPILFKLLETKNIKTASLMIQKEVCERLLASPNHKEYNALSIILQYHAEASKMMDVKRHMFYPVPNVDSAVIRIVKRSKPLIEPEKEKLFIRMVKEAFTQKTGGNDGLEQLLDPVALHAGVGGQVDGVTLGAQFFHTLAQVFKDRKSVV